MFGTLPQVLGFGVDRCFSVEQMARGYRPPVGRFHVISAGSRFSNLVLRRFAFSVYEPRRVDSMQADFELIERARSGDDAAFGQVVSVYRKRILGTISRLIGRPEDVEDVAQDVFLRLYFSLGPVADCGGF